MSEKEQDKPVNHGDATPMTQVLQTGAAPIQAAFKKAPKGFSEKLSTKLEEVLKLICRT
mgnify:CR=1 FL=1